MFAFTIYARPKDLIEKWSDIIFLLCERYRCFTVAMRVCVLVVPVCHLFSGQVFNLRVLNGIGQVVKRGN